MTDKRYKIGVIGGGAVGLIYSACLSNSADVIVKTRQQAQAVKIKNAGLSLFQDGVEENFTGIDASSDPTALQDCDVIIFAVKNYDTATAAKEVARFLKSDAEVVSLQNGLGATEILQSTIPNPARIFTGVTYIGGTRIDGRSVKLGNNRKTVIDSNATRLISALDRTKYGVESSTHIQQAVWDKMALNTAQNALSAVTGFNLGEMLKSEYCLDIAGKLLTEFEQVANAEGIDFDYTLMEKLKDNWQMSSFYPSMWQDLHKVNRTEVDAINGALVVLGKKHDIPTPYNDMLTSLIKILEKKPS